MKNINLDKFKATLKSEITKERYLEIVASYKLLAKKAKKRQSESSMELYLLNALIRGRSVECITHNVNTHKFKKAVTNVYDYLNGKEYRFKYSFEGRIPSVLDEAFGLSESERELIYMTAIKSKELN